MQEEKLYLRQIKIFKHLSPESLFGSFKIFLTCLQWPLFLYAPVAIITQYESLIYQNLRI